MRVYIVIFDAAEEGVELLHIASSEEKAKEWVAEKCKPYLRDAVEIEEVEVDGDYY